MRQPPGGRSLPCVALFLLFVGAPQDVYCRGTPGSAIHRGVGRPSPVLLPPPAPRQTIWADTFRCQPSGLSWCRRRGSNPHVLADTGFWDGRV